MCIPVFVLTSVSDSFSGWRLGRVEPVVGVQFGLREAAQQGVHGAGAQTWRPAVRRGGGGYRQLHWRPLHTEWVTSASASPSTDS